MRTTRALDAPESGRGYARVTPCVSEFAILPGEFAISPREFAILPGEFAISPREFATSPREFAVPAAEFTGRHRRHGSLKISVSAQKRPDLAGNAPSC